MTMARAASQAAVYSSALSFRLQKETGLHRFKNRLFLSAGSDQELLNILQIILLHGETPVQRPVLVLSQDTVKTMAVKKVCRPFDILLRKSEKIRLCPDIGKRKVLIRRLHRIRLLLRSLRGALPP